MFAKLGKKYGVPSPLDDASNEPTGAPAAIPKSASITSSGSSFPFATKTSTGVASFGFSGSNDNPASTGPGKTSSTSLPGFASPAAASTPAFSGATAVLGGATPAFGISPSPFGQPSTSQASFGNAATPPASGSTKFGGRTPREVLTEFYQKHNPSKVSEVDKLLTKYLGNEEQLFRNLAAKYKLDPAQFGVSSASTPAAFGTPTAGGAGFGQPSSLGTPSAGGIGFGQPSSLGSSPFVGTPSSFSAAATPSSGGFGQFSSQSAGFGSSSSPGGASFGSLAQGPAPSGFGTFGAPQQNTPFGGSGFVGTPRR